ncbi:MAG: sigma-70 family RNA polymerase sigma factor [bacterium]|nr:sigma-70 family RNA polymerase sigma factor [bacterium]
MPRSNEQWVSRLKARQDTTLIELRGILIRNLGKALVRHSHVDEGLIEDMVQDSVMRILDRLDQFEGNSQFVTWATSIAIRVAMGELRRRRWKDVSLSQILPDANTTFAGTVDSAPPPERILMRQSMVQAMYEAMEKCLSERQRTALLAELKGMPLDEIAQRMGSNRNAIYKLTHDARKKLRTGLEAAGYTAEDINESTSEVIA